jgi:hypothetical protein
VCQFFEGLGIKVPAETVTMLHNAAGEAFIALENPGQMEDVLKANRQQVGKRYVECFGASVAEREQAFERNQATMKEDAGFRGVLRMRGLPYNTTAEDIVEVRQLRKHAVLSHMLPCVILIVPTQPMYMPPLPCAAVLWQPP